MTDERAALERLVRRLRLASRLQIGLGRLIAGAYLALFLCGAILWLKRFGIEISPEPFLPAALLPPAAAFGSAWFARLRPHRLLAHADRRYGLHEELLTAYELTGAGDHLSLPSLLTLRRAASRCPNISPAAVFPLRPRFHPTLAGASTLFLLIALFIRPFAVPQGSDQASGAPAERLAELSRRIAEVAPQRSREEEEIIRRLQGLARRMQERPFEDEETRQMARELEDRLRQRVEALERDLVERSLTGEAGRDRGEAGSPDFALRRRPSGKGEELGIAPGSGEEGGESQQHRQLREELQRALEEMEEMGRKEKAEATPQAPGTGQPEGKEEAPDEKESAAAGGSGGAGGEAFSSPAEGGALAEEREGSSGGATGYSGSSPGEAAVEDHFDAPPAELSEEESGEPSTLRGRREEGESTKITIRAPAQPGEVTVPLTEIEVRYQRQLEEVMDRRRIPPEERELAGSYLYAIGASEEGEE